MELSDRVFLSLITGDLRELAPEFKRNTSNGRVGLRPPLRLAKHHLYIS